MAERLLTDEQEVNAMSTQWTISSDGVSDVETRLFELTQLSKVLRFAIAGLRRENPVIELSDDDFMAIHFAAENLAETAEAAREKFEEYVSPLRGEIIAA